MSTPLSLLFFIGFAILSYIAVPLLIRGIRNQSPSTYIALGEPRFNTVFSRDPKNWGVQFRFMGFVLSGRAATITHGWVRIAAAFAFVAYVGGIASFVSVIYVAIHGTRP